MDILNLNKNIPYKISLPAISDALLPIMSKADKSNKTSCHDNNTSFAILNSTDNRSTNSPYRSPFISSSTSWENLNLTCFRHIVFPC